MSSLHLNIDLSFQQLVDVVKQLSPSDKLRLNEELWNDDIPIPNEHQELVRSRISKSKEDPSRMKNWDDIVVHLER